MQIFRKKYLYNPENPVYESANVRKYNCMETESKNNQLIILHHHNGQVPQTQPTPGVLQPIEGPTTAQPFSVYPLVNCCSEIGKISEVDAMYVIKCLCDPKLKNVWYSVLSPQGICSSAVEGILPTKSPDIFTLAIGLLDIPASLSVVEKSVVSKNGYAVCRGLRDGHDVSVLLSSYGWKEVKKDKDIIKDDQFWVFKAKKREQGSFHEDYYLSWSRKFGLSKLKYIDLTKEGYEDDYYKDFVHKVKFYQANDNPKVNTLQIYKFVKELKGIKMFVELANQGNLADYIDKKHQAGFTLTENNALGLWEGFIKMMLQLTKEDIRAFGGIHIKNVFIHNNKICLGEPMLFHDKIQKKLRDQKSSFDYYAPELKENVILPDKFLKIDFEKVDIWSFGMLLHKFFSRDVPTLNTNQQLMLQRDKMSYGMSELIIRCLSVNPKDRPSWEEIKLRELPKQIVEEYAEEKVEREEIRLGSRRENKKPKVEETFQVQKEKERDEILDEINLMPKEEEEEAEPPIPVALSSRLKKIKLVVKILVVLSLYLFVFFRPALGSTMQLIYYRTLYTPVTLNLVDTSGNVLSPTTLITHDAYFFLLNDINFNDLQNVYHCIDNRFDPINNPLYSLNTYIGSSDFLSLMLTAWAMCLFICTAKGLTIWRGGISNRPAKKQCRYWVVYSFQELSLAALLFAHFYIYQFFYFAGASPCLSITYYNDLEPFFDSSLYLFLSNKDGYMLQVFSTLGVLSLILAISSCYSAWFPKLDSKYFLSAASITLRVVPFLLLLLLCRIGVASLYSPTAINDASSILPAVISGSAVGFFGVIPEIFVMICVVVEILLEIGFYYCELKAAESDSLSKLFNINSKKRIPGEGDDDRLNDMSLENSKHHLNDIND